MSTQERRYAGEPAPARNRGPSGFATIAWARVGLPVRIVSLSSLVTGSYLHWVSRASMLCVAGTDAGCALCNNKWDRRWYGWLLGVSIDTGTTLLAQIPYESYCRATALHTADLLGATVALHRSERNRRLVTVGVDARRQPVERKPGWTEPDVMAMLVARFQSFAAFRERDQADAVKGGE